jgi:hypothetical protein
MQRRTTRARHPGRPGLIRPARRLARIVHHAGASARTGTGRRDDHEDDEGVRMMMRAAERTIITMAVAVAVAVAAAASAVHAATGPERERAGRPAGTDLRRPPTEGGRRLPADPSGLLPEASPAASSPSASLPCVATSGCEGFAGLHMLDFLHRTVALVRQDARRVNVPLDQQLTAIGGH